MVEYRFVLPHDVAHHISFYQVPLSASMSNGNGQYLSGIHFPEFNTSGLPEHSPPWAGKNRNKEPKDQF